MSNFYVDGGAALTSDRDDWETPRWLFDKLDAVWHFTLDPASNGRNALCEKFFTKEDDGLAQSWGGILCSSTHRTDVRCLRGWRRPLLSQ